jgi:HEAT repeat protein
MLRRWIVFALMIALQLVLVPAGRAEDEPTFADRKLSAWLTDLHEGKDVKTRKRGVLALELIGQERSKKVIPALVKALQEDKDASIRAAAARAVGRSVAKVMDQARADKKEELPRFDNARDALAKALRTEKAETVREAAATALGEIGPDARGAVGSLASALKDKHLPTVKAAATALRRMGKDARDAQDELQTLLGDKKADTEARTDAAVALGQIRPTAIQSLSVMKEVLADAKTEAVIRRAVADALGKMGRDASDATGTLAGVLTAKDSPVDLRLAAVTAIDQFGRDGSAAIPALIKAAVDNDRFVRCLAMQVLGRMGRELDTHRKDAVKALLKSADDGNVEVSVAAIESLAALSADGLAGESDEVVKKLDSIIRREGRKSIREAAQIARDKIRPKKKE